LNKQPDFSVNHQVFLAANPGANLQPIKRQKYNALSLYKPSGMMNCSIFNEKIWLSRGEAHGFDGIPNLFGLNIATCKDMA
jgi:hypothetical protein